MYCIFNIRVKENLNRGEIVFCYKFVLIKGKKFFLNKIIEEKIGIVRKKRRFGRSEKSLN